jgi:hypothetical protein
MAHTSTGRFAMRGLGGLALLAGALVATTVPATGQAGAATSSSSLAPAAIQSGVGSLSGVVVSRAGRPAAGACVRAVSVAPQGGQGAVASRLVTTGALGRYLLTDLPAGSYRIGAAACPTVSPAGRSTPEFAVTQHPFTRLVTVVTGTLRPVESLPLPGAPITVDRDGRPSLPALVGHPVRLQSESVETGSSGGISGTVTDPKGDPLAGICAIAITKRGRGFQATTSSTGAYEVDHLRPGSYVMGFEPGCGNNDNWLPALYDNAAPIVVTAGQVTGNIDESLVLGGGISGTVTETNGTPLVDVCVTAINSVAGSVSIFTELGLGPGGSYGFSSISPGRYEVSFAGCGANVAPQFWNDQSSYKGATILQVAAGPSLTGIDAAMAPGGSISGVVRSHAGKGLAGICVSITMQLTRSVSLTTGYTSHAGGRYDLSALGTGDYRPLFTSGCGNDGNYAPTTPARIPVVAGKLTSGADVTMLTGATISGTVTDTGGTPLAGICVVIAATTSLEVAEEVPAEVSTSASGSYKIDQLPAGSYGLEFTPGCGNKGNFVTQFYDDQISPSLLNLITVATGGSATGIDASLQKGGTLRGTVAGDGGGEGACVVTSPVEDGYVGSEVFGLVAAYGVQANKNGTFRITGLPSDEYAIFVDPTCGGEFASSSAAVYYGGGDTYPPSRVVSVEAGQETGEIEVTLPEGGGISGTAAPANGGCLYLFDPTTHALTSQLLPALSPTGGYDVQSVLPGNYVVAFAQCDVRASAAPQYFPGSSTFAGGQPIEVTAGATTPNVNFDLPPTARISGRVTDAAGPVSRVCVVALPRAGVFEGSALTNAAGDYVISGIGTGSFTVGFRACGRTQVTASAAVTGVRAIDGQTTANVNAVLPPAGAIAGTVVSKAGEGLGGVCVLAPAAPGGAFFNETFTEPDGTFVLPGLPSGQWTVEFQPDCGIYGQWSGSRTPVTVVAGQTTTGVDVALAPGGSITGRVSGSNGRGISEICVLAVSTRTHRASDLAITSGGSYSIVALSPGSYDIEFTNGCGKSTLYTTQWWKDAASQGTATPVVVRSGQSTTGIDARLEASP